METLDSNFVRRTIQLTPGRNLWASRRVDARLNAAERAALGRFTSEAVAAAEQAVRLFGARRKKATKLYGDAARAKDEALDAVVSGIHGHLTSLGRIYGSDTEAGERVERLLGAFFPGGLAAVTNIAYVDELAQCERIQKLAAEDAHVTDVRALPALPGLLALLEERAADLARELEREASDAPTYRDARAAADVAERRMTELLMAVFTLYPGDAPGPARRRTELLDPYLVQLESMRERYRRRMPPAEIDPDTGELEHDPEPAAASPETEAAR
jgi:hypothetical protein